MFLRHLRRTRVLIHVVDASTPDPVDDYSVLREVCLCSLHQYALHCLLTCCKLNRI